MGGRSSRNPTPTVVQNTTQQQVQGPWQPAQAQLQDIIGQAQALYHSGQGSQVYGGERLAGFGGTTQDAMRQLETQARGGPSQTTTTGTNWLAGLLGSGGMSQGTRDALGDLRNVGNVDLSGFRAFNNDMGAPGNPLTQTAGDFQSGGRDINTERDYRGLAADGGLTPELRATLARFAGPSMTEQNLGGVARGDYLKGSNPYLEDLISQSASDAAGQVASRFSGAGRYGSGYAQRGIADAANRVATEARVGEYGRERERQASANAAIDALNLARGQTTLGAQERGLGRAQTALDAITGVQNQNNQNRLAGANLGLAQGNQRLAGLTAQAGQEQFNSNLGLEQARARLGAEQGAVANAMAGLGQLPMLEQLRMQPIQQLLGLGASQDAMRQSQLDNQRQIHQEYQQAPWRQLGLYQAAAQPIGAMGSQGTSTQQQARYDQQPGGAQQAMAYASGGLGMLGQLFGPSGQSGTGPSLASSMGSSLSAMLPMLLALSDERAKEDISPVGKLDDGQTVYSYRYKMGGPKQIGLLAQEVEKVRPSAVHESPEGVKFVDYAAATAKAKKRAA